ncbi:MAG: hypothetical protein M3Y53_02940, partial [Thermoproteota archaeon]|nr:hypothetical protein [Thermoproteota archaeon]
RLIMSSKVSPLFPIASSLFLVCLDTSILVLSFLVTTDGLAGIDNIGMPEGSDAIADNTAYEKILKMV